MKLDLGKAVSLKDNLWNSLEVSLWSRLHTSLCASLRASLWAGPARRRSVSSLLTPTSPIPER